MPSINLGTNNLCDVGDAGEMQRLLTGVLADMTALKTQLNQLRNDFNAHTHTGVTTGASASGAPSAASSATDVTFITTQ